MQFCRLWCIASCKKVSFILLHSTQVRFNFGADGAKISQEDVPLRMYVLFLALTRFIGNCKHVSSMLNLHGGMWMILILLACAIWQRKLRPESYQLLLLQTVRQHFREMDPVRLE